jgi:crotonobetainyl-CoA:carnitine CoA-transferase CaiB-like acyl-CoA transferase
MADNTETSRLTGQQQGKRALEGVRVLDLTQVMSGPFCTMVLADLGADVIKVENPENGDQTRRSWGFSVEGRDSRAFLSLNRNKRSVTMDLKTDAGVRQFMALAETADVVIENFRPGVAARLGVGYEAVRAMNSRVVYASISGFGQTGPYAAYPGYDLIAQAMTGIMSVTGEPGDRPVKCGIPIADLGAGLFSATAILAALYERGEDGDGQYVETSLFESALALSVWESTEYWATGEIPLPLGSANRMSAPYQALETKDGFITIGANNGKLWNKLCQALDTPALATDPRFADNNKRMENRSELVRALEHVLKRRSTDEWVRVLLENGVPAGPIRDYRQVLEEDPHVRARGMIEHFDHAAEGKVPVLASPLRLSRTPVRRPAPPPMLGQHNGELLSGLGAACNPAEERSA